MDKSISHTQLVKEIDSFLDRYQSDLSYCHGADHARRVAKLALKISAVENADNDIIEVAALLHDIGVVPLAWGRHASGKDTDDFQVFLGQFALPSSDHGEVGALIARRFLENHDYPEDRTKRVELIISEHNRNLQTTLESKIVNDADKLEQLGATWVARAFQRTSAFDKTLGIESVPERLLDNKEKIPLDSFHTETAATMAAERKKFLVAFNEQFRRELGLEK